MNIKQLEIFVAIATTGSFSRGAEVVCITQSTASQHIAALEDYCGIRLLDRTGRGIVATEAGKVLLDHAEKILVSLESADQAILQFRQADGVELCIGGSTIPGTYILPGVISALRETSPGISVNVEISGSRKIIERLLADKIEIGIIGGPTVDKGIEVERLGSDIVHLVARNDHPWCKRSEIQPEELMGVPLILRESGSGTSGAVRQVLSQQAIDMADLKVAATMSGSEAVKQSVLAGVGVGFISGLAVRGEVERGELVVIAIAGITIERPFELAWRQGRSISPAAEAFSVALKRVWCN